MPSTRRPFTLQLARSITSTSLTGSFGLIFLGEDHGYIATNTNSTPGLNELQFAVAETDSWYESYVSECSDETLSESITFRFTDDDAGTMTREEMLLHVITHGSYHRGNVGQVLKSISVAPPRDLYTKFLHVSEPARRQA